MQIFLALIISLSMLFLMGCATDTPYETLYCTSIKHDEIVNIVKVERSYVYDAPDGRDVWEVYPDIDSLKIYCYLK